MTDLPVCRTPVELSELVLYLVETPGKLIERCHLVFRALGRYLLRMRVQVRVRLIHVHFAR